MPSQTSGAAVERAISQLTTSLAGEVISAFLAAPLGDVAPLLAELGGGPHPVARRGSPLPPGPKSPTRRSADLQVRDRGDALDRIVAMLAASPEGTRSEVIRRALHLDKALFLHAVADGIEVGRIRKTGRLRGTTYFVA